LGTYAWESVAGAGNAEAVQKRWALYHFGGGAERYLEAAELLRQASQEPAFQSCLQYQYSYVNDKVKEWPRLYPKEALEHLEKLAEATVALRKTASTAETAAENLSRLLESEKLDNQEKNGLMSLLGDAARVQALSEVFAWLLALRQELKAGPARKSHLSACEQARATLKDRLKVFAENKPLWVVPAASQPLSALLLFLDQLASDLKAASSRKKGATIRWNLPDDWEIPQEN
jgi:hypothetical protein